jgi:hypothetical protein
MVLGHVIADGSPNDYRAILKMMNRCNWHETGAVLHACVVHWPDIRSQIIVYVNLISVCCLPPLRCRFQELLSYCLDVHALDLKLFDLELPLYGLL